MAPSRDTLLFVDDEPDVLDVLCRMFEHRYDVLTAPSGPEALEVLRARRVDLLVTDQRMPGMTGLQLVAAARAEGHEVPALLLTGYTDPADLIAALNSGHIHRYLTKPWDVPELVLAVQQALELTRLRREKERVVRQLHRRVEALGLLDEVGGDGAVDPVGADVLLERVLTAIEDDAQRRLAEQKRLEQRKEEFVSMVSHELRTPLTSIAGAVDLVLTGMTGELNEKQARYLAMAKEGTEKLNAVVDDLLDLSRADQGRLRVAFEPTRLDALVQRTVERYGAACLERRLSVAVELPEAPVPLLADPNRLGQVLGNLLTNAVKFTPGGGEVRVALAPPDAAQGFAILTVWNSGEPIAEADLERIFDRFEQARTRRTRTVRGTGLGLAICRHLVEAHGGRIWAEPCEDGARFVVVLPLQPAPELVRGEAPVPLRPESPPRRRPRGLVVGELPAAYAVKALLLPLAESVRVAPTLDEGLLLARQHRPDLVVVTERLEAQAGRALEQHLQVGVEPRPVALVAPVAGAGADPRGLAARAQAALALLEGATVVRSAAG